MRRQRPGHRIWSFHHRGLLLLAAAVAVLLFFLYGCVAGAVYSPGAAGVRPSRTGFRQSYDFAFSAFIWKDRRCPPHGTMCGPI